jgi:hypothetical protein
MTAVDGPAGEGAARAMLRRELLPWALLGLTLGMVEGATAAVLLKHRFQDGADPFAVNLAVGLVSGAPALSNVVSFVWANLAHARARVRLVVGLQAAFAVAVGVVGLAPAATGGLLLTLASILAARVLWSGILTIRSSIWIANYPRHLLARCTGRIVVASSLTMAAGAAATALALGGARLDPRWLYGGAALAGLAGAWLFRATRVRREYQLLDAEQAAVARSDAFSLRTLLQILREDRDYREYMFWMGLYGGGNLMLTSQLVVVLTERLAMPPGRQIAMLAVLPLAALPLFVPMWARLFDGSHVVAYRARQGWVQVAAVAILCGGAFAALEWLLWLGAAVLGVALAGSNLGWSLGHNDFAAPGRAQHYMGVHVTLTGLRGMLAPPLGIAAYQGLEALAAGAGRWSLLLPLAGTAAGAAGFGLMRRRLGMAGAGHEGAFGGRAPGQGPDPRRDDDGATDRRRNQGTRHR